MRQLRGRRQFESWIISARLRNPSSVIVHARATLRSLPAGGTSVRARPGLLIAVYLAIWSRTIPGDVSVMLPILRRAPPKSVSDTEAEAEAVYGVRGQPTDLRAPVHLRGRTAMTGSAHP